MKKKFSNKLTARQVEALAILAEECGEVVKVVGKILRHGIDSHHPTTHIDNREYLENELGDVTAAIKIIIDEKIVTRQAVDDMCFDKLQRIGKYLHHIKVKSP
jgi:NTP pyrophosphatase (non-canonical NTP hydrolase)